MANEKHRSLLIGGADTWNKWRHENAENEPDLDEANLFMANLGGADLSQANLSRAYLFKANLFKANLTGANLFKANLRQANLFETDLSRANLSGANLGKTDLSRTNLSRANLRNTNLTGANLTGANLTGADLSETDLRGLKFFKANLTNANLRQANLSETDLRQADLSGADLTHATLGETHLENANLDGCRICGISAWNLQINQTTRQSDLVITLPEEAAVTVSDLEVAQFIYSLLHRKRLRNVFNTVTSRAVLLLGCFIPERKVFLDALTEDLRRNRLLPIVFDFERATSRDFDETIKILAGLSLFVIVDITKPKLLTEDLTALVPDYRTPLIPILHEGEDSYSMFTDLTRYDWVLRPVLTYGTRKELLEHFRNIVLEWAWKKHLELRRKKHEDLETMSIKDAMEQKENAGPDVAW